MLEAALDKLSRLSNGSDHALCPGAGAAGGLGGWASAVGAVGAWAYWSVRNGVAGRPSSLKRFTSGVAAQP